MEKHALTKVRENCKEPLPAVHLVATFKDQFKLYFVTELLNHKYELWEHCRSFGMINPELARFTFLQICLSVKQLHNLELVHRDLKVSTVYIFNIFAARKHVFDRRFEASYLNRPWFGRRHE